MCHTSQHMYPIYKRLHLLDKDINHVCLLVAMFHLEAYEDLDDYLTLTVVMDEFLGE